MTNDEIQFFRRQGAHARAALVAKSSNPFSDRIEVMTSSAVSDEDLGTKARAWSEGWDYENDRADRALYAALVSMR